MACGLSSFSQVVLILAPAGAEAHVMADMLATSGISARACPDVADLCAQIDDGCGAVVLAVEELSPSAISKIQVCLQKQETWSDLPILLLTDNDLEHVAQDFTSTGNISLLPRTAQKMMLTKSVEVALRARLKQYEVRNLLSALKRSRDDAERANIAKSQFLANMSHEIRTPIGAIMGFIDLARSSGSSPEEKSAYMEIINRNSQHLLRLIDDILDLSKVEAGRMAIEQVRFRFNDFLADFINHVRMQTIEKGLDLRIDFLTPVPEWIITDPIRLRQVLWNIVGNAVKFTEQGTVSIQVEYDSRQLHFHVRDTGIGLTDQQVAKLFQPFAQADTSTTRKFGGTGLGLVLARRLCEAMGGDLSLDFSHQGTGSQFSFSVQVEKTADSRLVPTAELQADTSASTPGERDKALKGLKVLLVEDSPDNQILISTFLRQNGARIEIRNNGEEGSEAALHGHYDVVLMDVQMPVMDGHEATKHLRKMNYSKPIVALTAHAMNDERIRCIASGFTEYLTKPIHVPLLIDVLHRFKPVNQRA